MLSQGGFKFDVRGAFQASLEGVEMVIAIGGAFIGSANLRVSYLLFLENCFYESFGHVKCTSE